MDKYQLELWGDLEAFGPVVELSEDELKVLAKVFGTNSLHLHSSYESVRLVNVSEQERKAKEAKAKELAARRAVREKYVAADGYGGYNTLATAFARAMSVK